MASAMNQIPNYSKPATIVYSDNEFFPELVTLAEVRATHPEFEQCGVMAALVRFQDGGYHVQVTKQYAIGGKQYLEEKRFFSDIRSALKFMYGTMRKAYNEVATRKFTVDILGADL